MSLIKLDSCYFIFHFILQEPNPCSTLLEYFTSLGKREAQERETRIFKSELRREKSVPVLWGFLTASAGSNPPQNLKNK